MREMIKNVSFGQILTDHFQSASPREMERLKVDLTIYVLLSQS